VREVSDADILDLLRDRKSRERGFRVLIQQYQERLYWHVRRLVHDHDDADDVLQNTFVKAFKGIARFKGNAKLYTWLYRIATNEAISFLKARQRRVTMSLNDADLGLEEKLKADVFFEGDAVVTRLVQALETLPEKQRAVFNMRYYDEMSYRDMSQVFGTSEGALKASYHHAVKKIEAFFKEAQV
jgi:RNA polymerase sigma-70 factor (ECF subfamily)